MLDCMSFPCCSVQEQCPGVLSAFSDAGQNRESDAQMEGSARLRTGFILYDSCGVGFNVFGKVMRKNKVSMNKVCISNRLVKTLALTILSNNK